MTLRRTGMQVLVLTVNHGVEDEVETTVLSSSDALREALIDTVEQYRDAIWGSDYGPEDPIPIDTNRYDNQALEDFLNKKLSPMTINYQSFHVMEKA